MTLYAQHGYQRGTKIEAGLAEGWLNGVILSPRDETRESLSAYVSQLRKRRGRQPEIMIDPQFYASSIPNPRLGHLDEYPYFRPGLTRTKLASAAEVKRVAADTLGFQSSLPLDYLISPSVFVNDLNDQDSQVALSLAAESIAFHASMDSPPPLLVSIVIDEESLQDRSRLSDFLDIVSLYEVEGFYVVVRRRDPGYQAAFDSRSLAGLLHLVYSLAETNDFAVVCGFTDLVGLMVDAAGAKATATGWFNSLRQFSLSRFQQSTGGRPARSRYTSSKLLNSILITPELDTVYERGRLDDVLSNTKYDGVFRQTNPANASWPAENSYLHHWGVVSSLGTSILSKKSTLEKVAELERLINAALGTYAILASSGIVFEVATGPRELRTWQEALAVFRAEVE
jgi:hypothetical protein